MDECRHHRLCFKSEPAKILYIGRFPWRPSDFYPESPGSILFGQWICHAAKSLKICLNNHPLHPRPNNPRPNHHQNMKTQKLARRFPGRFLIVTGSILIAAVTARADYQSTVLADHPLAFYPINATVDPTGTTATDLSGNGNNGTYNGTDPQDNSVAGPTTYIPNALFFDGATSFVDLSTGTNTS